MYCDVLFHGCSICADTITVCKSSRLCGVRICLDMNFGISSSIPYVGNCFIRGNFCIASCLSSNILMSRIHYMDESALSSLYNGVLMILKDGLKCLPSLSSEVAKAVMPLKVYSNDVNRFSSIILPFKAAQYGFMLFKNRD